MWSGGGLRNFSSLAGEPAPGVNSTVRTNIKPALKAGNAFSLDIDTSLALNKKRGRFLSPSFWCLTYFSSELYGKPDIVFFKTLFWFIVHVSSSVALPIQAWARDVK